MAVSPFGKLPLESGTFSSRISRFMSSGKNYVSTGFKPGYALQAAELNETHEQFLFYQTLNNRSSYNWKSYDVNSIPFWDGATIYNPISITTTNNGNQLTISFLPTWLYLLDSTSTNPNNSGIGFWVNTTKTTSITITPPSNAQPVRYGFTYSIETINVTQDPELKDESNSLIAGITVPGADRIKINNIRLTQFESGVTKFSELFAAKRDQNTYAIYWPYSNYSKKISGDISVS